MEGGFEGIPMPMGEWEGGNDRRNYLFFIRLHMEITDLEDDREL